MALAYYRSFGLPVTVLRPFNAFGPRQSARAIIPTIICQLAADAKELKLGNLSPTRDFTYVEDLADAYAAIIAAESVVGETINIGTGTEISVQRLAETLIRLMDSSAVVTTVPERLRPPKSEVDRLVCDSSLAGKVIGWKPKTSLEAGLSRTIDWFTTADNLRGYHPGRYQV